jgi:MFS family permease
MAVDGEHALAHAAQGGIIVTDQTADTSAPDAAIASGTSGVETGLDAAGRPTRPLPMPQLIQISLYWLGLTVVWGGWEILGQERIEEFFEASVAPAMLGLMEATAVIMAIAVQPTVGNISDYTMSRWGRRKPYIFVGTVLDFVFLVAIAFSATPLAFFTALVMLQFSANFAQGPFQGYVPDLVPEKQVGIASGLAGLAQVFGNILGTIIIIGGFVVFQDYTIPTITLGLVELLTMIGTVLWVHEGLAAKPREGRRWREIARETWAMDVLRERDYVWLIASRLFFLTAAGMLINTQVFYMERTMGFDGSVYVSLPFAIGTVEEVEAKAFWIGVATLLFALTAVLVVIPSARISDRVGRKPVIWAACLFGGIAMTLAAVTPGIALFVPAVVLLAAASGIFLAVDWAFMTDVIPKISAGRYMGLSNVATASSTALAPAIGGLAIFIGGSLISFAAGPRLAQAVAVVLFIIAALLLRNVHDRIYEERRAERMAGAAA